MRSKTEKTLIVGLDGLSWEVIDRLIDIGKLKTIKSLMDDGVYGVLSSVEPSISPTAWASFLTGKEPKTHGIFGFTTGDNTYARNIPVCAKNIEEEKIHEILSNNGKKVGLLNVPMTYPPEAINGFIVSGLETPSKKSNYTYPEQEKLEIEEKIGEYFLDIEISRDDNKLKDADYLSNYYSDSYRLFFEDLEKVTKKRLQAFLYLVDKYNPDLSMIVFTGTDRIQHVLWHYIKGIVKNEKRKIETKIIQYYELVDQSISKLISQNGGYENIFIISDHGFGELQGDFYINVWLKNEGYMKLDRLKSSSVFGTAKNMVKKLGVKRELLEKLVGRNKIEKITGEGSLIDWKGTKAYNYGWNGIRINLVDREMEGSVDINEYHNVCDQIEKQIYELKCRITGKPIVKNVLINRDLDSVKVDQKSPDIYLEMADAPHYTCVNVDINRQDIFGKNMWKTGEHRKEGIIVAKGKAVARRHRIDKCNLIDIMPTILYCYKQEIPRNVDGRILKEILRNEILTTHKEVYRQEVRNSTNVDEIYSDQELEDVTQRLKDLGYL